MVNGSYWDLGSTTGGSQFIDGEQPLPLEKNMLIKMKTNGGPEDLQTILYTMGLWKTYMLRSFYGK